jgi:hypothetical protein
MQQIIEYARTEGFKTIEGQVLSENTTMLAMCRELGFEIQPDPNDPDACNVRLVINGAKQPHEQCAFRAPNAAAAHELT